MKTIYFGGNIITMEEEGASVEAVAVENGKIIATGSLETLKDQMGPDADMIHLEGKTMLPGFIDPHGHITMIGTIASMANLRHCSNFADIQAVFKQYIEEKPAEERKAIIGFGYDHNFLDEKGHPTKEVLNQVSKDIPILALHSTGHVAGCNDAALRLAKIDEKTEDPEGGMIGRLENSKEPNGYLEETAVALVQAALYQAIDFDFEKLALMGQDIYLQYGITTAQDGGTDKNTLKLLQSFAEKNLLKIDTVAYPVVEAIVDGMEIDEAYKNKYQNKLKVGGYKLFLDGSPQAKTAWMSEPYEGEESYCGYHKYDDQAAEAFVQRAVDDSMQLLTHCNGDAASEQFIRSYEKALDHSTNENKKELRPVMIHCQTVREDQLKRMKAIDMIPSIFVGHAYFWGDIHLKNFGERRGNKISPAKSAFNEGLVVNFHQDSPVTEPDMLHTIWAAVNRITRLGKLIGPEERVSVFEALQAVTINAAYAYFEEDQKGTISEGKVADFVILDQNPFEVDPLEIKDIQVMETIKGGESLYQKS